MPTHLLPTPDLSPSQRDKIGARIAAAVLWITIFLCCGLPLAWLAGCVLRNPAAMTSMVWDVWTLRLFLKTLCLGASAGAIATLLSIGPALLFGGRSRLSSWLIPLLPFNVLLPSIVLSYGWGAVLSQMNIFPFPQSAADHARCVWALSTWLWPIPCGVLALALRQTPRDLLDQARLDGAAGRIIARRLLAPLLGGFLLATMLSMQEFAVFEPTGISVLATEVRMIFETGSVSSPTNPIVQLQGGVAAVADLPDQGRRAATALGAGLPAIATVVSLLAAGLRLTRRAAQPALDTQPIELQRLRPPGGAAAALISIALAVLLPVAGLFIALHKPFDPLAMYSEFTPQLNCSITLAAAAGCAALIWAFLMSVKSSKILLWLTVASFLMGGQYLAIALLRLFDADPKWMGDFSPMRLLLETNVAVVMAFLARFGWIAMLAGDLTHRGVYRPLREMAAVEGAGPIATAWHIILPRAWPSLLAAALLVATLSLTEVPASALLTPPSIVPMMLTWVHMQMYGPMIEASLAMVCVVLIATIAVMLLVRLGTGAVRPLAGLLLIILLNGCGKAQQPEAIWCSTGQGAGQVVYPRGIAYSPKDDTFFVIDRAARIQHINQAGQPINGWQMPEFAQGKPVGLTVGRDGNLWVPDTHYHRIIIFSPQGRELFRFGTKGHGHGEFDLPTSIAFDSAGNIYVGEYGENNRIQVFDQNWNFLRQIGDFGGGDGQVSRPQSLVIIGDDLYTTDSCNHRIAVFKLDGTFVRNMGQSGSGPGQFRFPYGLEMDCDGALIVTEFGNNRVQKIDPATGKSLGIWGRTGRLPGELAYPWAAMVTKDQKVVIVDSGNNRLQVINDRQFAFGQD